MKYVDQLNWTMIYSRTKIYKIIINLTTSCCKKDQEIQCFYKNSQFLWTASRNVEVFPLRFMYFLSLPKRNLRFPVKYRYLLHNSLRLTPMTGQKHIQNKSPFRPPKTYLVSVLTSEHKQACHDPGTHEVWGLFLRSPHTSRLWHLGWDSRSDDHVKGQWEVLLWHMELTNINSTTMC